MLTQLPVCCSVSWKQSTHQHNKNHQWILKGITEWEVRVDSLKMKHDETIAASIKIAIVVGMLPKEYQDLCFRQATDVKMTEESQYAELRNKIMNIATRKHSMVTRYEICNNSPNKRIIWQVCS